MKVNEIINEKQLNEIAPLIPAVYALGKAGLAAWKAGTIGKAAAGVIGGAKKAGLAHKIRQWTSKAPPDSSVPDALQKDKEGYGPGKVDPPLAQAARKNYPPKQTANPPQVAKRTNVGPMSKLQRATT